MSSLSSTLIAPSNVEINNSIRTAATSYEIKMRLHTQSKILVSGGAFYDFYAKNTILIYDLKENAVKMLDQNLPHFVYYAASVYYNN
jgi:hypothetical protein